MKTMQRAAVLLELIRALRNSGSWCGETSLQKCCYLLQGLLDVPLGFEFILYKYGPYSFDLTNTLTALRADEIVELRMSDPRYGLRFAVGHVGQVVLGQYPKTIARFLPHIQFIADRCGSKGVAELERLATAYFVTQLDGRKALGNRRAEHLRRLKPHVSADDALSSIEEIDSMIAEAASLSINDD